MDYTEAFKNLRTNNKWGRKSPHKAVLMLTVIEMFEQNILTDNEIFYDDKLKSMFMKVWNRVLPKEPLFHPDAYLPFWYLQNDSFWHIVPKRGQEDILSLMHDNNVKPSEAKLNDSVRCAELDEDLYFLMTLQSGRSSLKRVLLETYTQLSEDEIDRLSESMDNTIDYSATAMSEYEKILSQGNEDKAMEASGADNKLVSQFNKYSEDVQIELNLQYYSYLKKHRSEREVFKELLPSVYDLLDKIVNCPIRQGEIAPSFVFDYENFLSDLKIALMSDDGAMELIDKIGEAVEVLHGNVAADEDEEEIEVDEEDEDDSSQTDEDDAEEESDNAEDASFDDIEVEHVFVDSSGRRIDSFTTTSASQEKGASTENRRGKPWTEEEEDALRTFFNQGRDASTIAAIMGRTEVAIKSRLGMMGLIDYTYGQEEESRKDAVMDEPEKVDESSFTIENSFTRCYIVDKHGERVFQENAKLKYIGGKLYRMNLKRECFTLKSMVFKGARWMKGEKKIVAYPQTALYRVLDSVVEYCDLVEEIVDSTVFEDCRLKVNGVWYRYDGNPVAAAIDNKGGEENMSRKKLRILKGPLYAVRRQAVLRAMGYFRLPAKLIDIVRTISRTAWGDTIREDDVEDVISTMDEIEPVDGKYVLRKGR